MFRFSQEYFRRVKANPEKAGVRPAVSAPPKPHKVGKANLQKVDPTPPTSVKPKLYGSSGVLGKLSIQGPGVLITHIGNLDMQSAVSDLADGFTAAKRRSRKDLRKNLLDLYSCALILKHDQDSWLEFCRDSFWATISTRQKRPTYNKNDEALKFLLRRVMGSRADEKDRSMCHRALLPSFLVNRPVSALEELLRNAGGPQKLASKNRQDGKLPTCNKRQRVSARRENVMADVAECKSAFSSPFGDTANMEISLTPERTSGSTDQLAVSRSQNTSRGILIPINEKHADVLQRFGPAILFVEIQYDGGGQYRGKITKIRKSKSRQSKTVRVQ